MSAWGASAGAESPPAPPRLRSQRRWLFLGPAFVAAVAYVDPGNFATNVEAGAEVGYELVWVVVAANVAAIVIQTQSAKLGLVSGRSLPEHIRDRARRPVVVAAWLGAEIVAMATDLRGVTFEAFPWSRRRPAPAARVPGQGVAAGPTTNGGATRTVSGASTTRQKERA